MKKLFGNLKGLKSDQIRKLENLYRRRIPPEFIVTAGVSLDLSRLSVETGRQIGLMINRQGKIIHVIIGNNQGIMIPDISDYRISADRLRGLRCVHTSFGNDGLTSDDLTDLSLLRLDLIAAIAIKSDGSPDKIHAGHILPHNRDKTPYQLIPPISPHQLDIGCLDLIRALEAELAQTGRLYKADPNKEKALLISVTSLPKNAAMDSLMELAELSASSGIDVAETIIQQRRKADPRYLMGLGKLKELAIRALHQGAGLIIFDQELNPSQIRSITDKIDLKVIDRTQLILDIFAQRAKSREGKLQVELAQFKYLLPRLVTRNTAMSRLTGGIGGRGPGETKLEINRRRVRDRIKRLEKSLALVSRRRKQQKSKRHKKGLPVISIIGYTNTGKSTLLNTLTNSSVLVENQLFATLDPSSRRLKFPRDMEVIITDTVGFIKNLPQDLLVAFRATLEELENAELLLHVIDISNPRFENQIESVEKILSQLKLQEITTIRVLNKMDRIDMETVKSLEQRLMGTAISANKSATLAPLIKNMTNLLTYRLKKI
ncbi:MAG: GTPase HflX [Deltaproteobacteria bacterium]|nr:GTPase HflX [Deltaproteobacteria bacterium]